MKNSKIQDNPPEHAIPKKDEKESAEQVLSTVLGAENEKRA